MRVVRRGVFETNSSSTHSITLCSKEDYDKWKSGEVLKSGSNFITKEEAIESLKTDEYFLRYNPDFDFTDEDAVNEALKEDDYITSDEYFEDKYLENFKSTHITKNGEEIVAFGKYGRDG